MYRPSWGTIRAAAQQTMCAMPVQPTDNVADLRGLKCPEPLMMLRKAMRDLRTGDVLHVAATDATTQRDIPQYCRFVEHELIEQWTANDVYHYRLRKGSR